MVELKPNVWKVSNSPKIRSAPEISENCHPAAHGLPTAPFPAARHRDLLGERGGTRTLDPMIKSYEFLIACRFDGFRSIPDFP